MSTKIRLTIITLGGFLFVVDRVFKFFSNGAWLNDRVFGGFIGWHPFSNEGIAFGIPINNWLIIAISIPLIIFVIYLLFKESGMIRCGLWLIFFGAISNFFDRAYYQHTVDYFLVWISIFNLADILIVAGVLMCLIAYRNTKGRAN